jgi:hypothetical protein
VDVYWRSRAYPGTTPSSAACPAREMPITAKSVTNPVGSPRSSASTRPNGTCPTPRSIPNTAIASRFIHALCTS